jgi:predicted small lipoprotein YifL
MAYSVAALDTFNPQMKTTGFSMTTPCCIRYLLPGLVLLLCLGACGQRGPLYLPEDQPKKDQTENTSETGNSEKENSREETGENDEETP